MGEIIKDQLFSDTASYWRFDGNFNDDRANNNATSSGYAMVENEGKFNNCAYLPSSSYLTHGVTNLSYTAMSISFWMKPQWSWNDGVIRGFWQNNNNTNVNQGNWVSLFKYSNNITYWRIVTAGGTIQDATVLSTGFYTSGQWTHVVAGYDSTSSVLYVNNSLVVSNPSITVPGGFLDTTSRIGYGHQGDFGGGRISDFAYFNKKLDATEVGRLYSSGAHSSNLLSNYRRKRTTDELTGLNTSKYSLLDNRTRSRFVGTKPLAGESSENPVESAVQLRNIRPDIKTGYYYIKTKYMTAPVRTYCNFDWDGGGWMRLNSSLATLSSAKGSSPAWTGGDANWQPDLVAGSNVPSGCGNTTAVVTVACNQLDYTEALVLINRESTIIQCMGFTGSTSAGWYDAINNRYAGSATSNGTCTWGDNIWAHGCCGTSIGTNKKNWRILCSGANQFSISMKSECSDGSDTGRYLIYYYVR